ncbi:MAG: aldolase catalytic domain-containing protein [Pseudomonadota bacterium]
MLLDCSVRDGGYYNSWDFSRSLVDDYLEAMTNAGVNVVELGFRSLKNEGFLGPYAYTTDAHLESLAVPDSLTVGVMVNAGELVGDQDQQAALGRLFPLRASESRVSLVRVACHVHEFTRALQAADWLDEQGYRVGFNLMQVADRSEEELTQLAEAASDHPVEVLYFADSMGSMTPNQTVRIMDILRRGWSGPLGVHAHDNMGLALQNTLAGLDHGAEWVDSTVTGMGRGPGNTRTEELAFELSRRRGERCNLIPLMRTIRRHFHPLKEYYGWGTNLYYYLAGYYGIHPSYIQAMLGDSRYNEEDIFSVIEHLRQEGGKKFNLSTLDAARHFYQGKPAGSWRPADWLEGREIVLLGSGEGVGSHREAIESYIRRESPLVMALNTQSSICADLIDVRVACHPIRLLADCESHRKLPQPLITPYSMLPEDVQEELAGKKVLDFGIAVEEGSFEPNETYCTLPTSLVVAYALAIATSGRARRVLMAGFDGYGADDPRTREMQELIELYRTHQDAIQTISVTPTRYSLPTQSIYAL